MAEYLETIGVAVLAVGGIFAGRAFSRLGRPYWAIGYAAPFVLFGIIALARWFGGFSFVPPFSWLTAGRREFVVLAFSCTTLLTTELKQVAIRRQRVLVSFFMVIAVVHFSILPFALPAVLKGSHERLETVIDLNRVCIQGTTYTCGPAEAVTALDRLGLKGEEGAIAIAAYSNPVTGTPTDLLCGALEELYIEDGLTCEYRFFDTIAELKLVGLSIAVIKYSPMVDHYVVVLDISDDEIVLGDPLRGERTLTHDEFREIWRHDGVVLKKGEKEQKPRPAPRLGRSYLAAGERRNEGNWGTINIEKSYGIA
jgi:hypothetical protein